MDPLRNRLSEVRRKARRVMLTQGVCMLLAVGLGLLLVVGFSDWLTHYSDLSLLQFLAQPFDDPAVRTMLTIGIVGLAGWVGWRWLFQPLAAPLHDVDLALRVEARYPRLKDSFASAVQFVASGADPRIGSPALQRSVINRTLNSVERLDFLEVIDTRRMRLLVVIALGVGLIGTAAAAFNRTATSLALRRIAFPWSAPQWPRRTNLQLLTPEFKGLEDRPGRPLRVAKGDAFQIYVENTVGRLPSDVRLEYRIDGGRLQKEPLRPQSLRDASGRAREVAVGTLQATRGAIEFRAAGGDHNDMPFRKLLAIPPATAETFRVSLTPPAYTGRPLEVQPEGVGQVEALVGTRVQIVAKLSKPVRWAALKLKDQKARAVEVGEDRQSLTARFVIEQPGIDSWWLDLQDDEGFQPSDVPRYEIRGLPDQAPDVLLEQPATDLQVTPEAEIVVRASARDDLGLSSLTLVWSDGMAAAEAQSETRPLFDGEGRPQQYVSEFAWSLAELQKKPGDEIVFHVEARDDCDIGAPHIGRSTPRRLTFVSAEQKAEELTERQAGLLDDLERAFKMQDEALEQVNDLRVQLEKTGQLRPEDVDALQRVELSQRQIDRQLTDPADGLEKQARDILQELKANKIESPETESRVSNLSSEIRRLADQNLPKIADELTVARKTAQGVARPETTPPRDAKPPQAEVNPDTSKPGEAKPAEVKPETTSAESKPAETIPAESKPAEIVPTDSKPAEPKPAASKQSPASRTQGPLDRAAENQQAVKESLGEMLQQLAQWRNERDAVRDLTDVMTEQDAIRQQSTDLGQKTVNKDSGDLTPQERADLAKLAERQRKQAEKLEQLQNRIEDTADRLEKDEPGAGESFTEAVRHAREQSISEKMRDAANALEENQTGRAGQSQQDAMNQLQEMEDILRNRRESDAETLVKKLKQAEDDLQKLETQQEDLMKKRKEAEQIADPQDRSETLRKLDEEQQQIEDELQKLSRRLQRLQAQEAAEAVERSAERLKKSQQNQQSGADEDAEQEQREALDDIQQARRQLAQEREEAEETLAQQQLLRIASQLKSLIPRQQELIQETLRLENLRQEGSWTRSQLQTLLNLSKAQRQLKEEVDGLTETLTAAEVFALAMKGASRQMERAADRLAERDTGALTLRAQEAARKRFEDLIASLKPEKLEAPKTPMNQEEQPGGGGQQGGPPMDGIPILSQLRMLKTLQIELNERTDELAMELEKNGELTPDQQAELGEIAVQQGQVADLARNLTEQAVKMQGGAEEPKPQEDE